MRFLQHPGVARLVTSLATLAGVAVLVFVMLRAIPGDQITANLGTEAAPQTDGTARVVELVGEAIAVEVGMALAQGNLGFSSRAQLPVWDLIAMTAPVTLELALLSIVIALAVGVPIGMLAASGREKARDLVGQAIALVGLSIPAFLLATVLLTSSSTAWQFNPNGLGYAAPWVDLGLNLQQMLMPAMQAAPIIRTTRTAVLDIRGLDFIRTAKAKGVGPQLLQRRHILRNALVPIVTMTGLQFGYLLGGAVVVEQVFSLPGIGRQVLIGIQQKEYAVVQSTVLIIAVAFVLVNLVTDAVYRLVDPRVRAA